MVSTTKPIITYLRSLSHWNRNGKNHLIIDTRAFVNKTDLNLSDSIKNVQFGSAMISSPFFETSLLENRFREGYDLLMPTFRFQEKSANLWPYMPYMMPVRREFLFSFQGVKIMVCILNRVVITLSYDICIKSVMVMNFNNWTNLLYQ